MSRTDEELQRAIDSFGGDPADSDYQRGYLAALKWATGKREYDPGRPVPHHGSGPDNL